MAIQKILKGRKGTKGEARTEHGETKQKVTVSITPSARDNLDAVALMLGISRSELVERLARKGETWLVAQAR